MFVNLALVCPELENLTDKGFFKAKRLKKHSLFVSPVLIL
jgi:hypothetical protein